MPGVTTLIAVLALNPAELPKMPAGAGVSRVVAPVAAESHDSRAIVEARPGVSERAPRRQLMVWTSATCAPCRQFWADLACDPSFRAAVLSRFHIQWIDFDAFPAAAAAREIHSVPTFVLGDRQIAGYRGKQWLWSQLVEVADEAVAPNPAPHFGDNEPDPKSERSGTGNELPPLAPLGRSTRRAPSESPPTPDEPLQEPVSPVPTPTPPPALKPSVPWNTRQPPSLTGSLGEWLHRSVPLVLTGLELAGILGGTAATGGVGTIAIAALWTLWRRRRLRQRAAVNGRRDAITGDQSEEAAAGVTVRAPFPRQLDEARELLALRQTEGRVAALDALRGMFLDDEIAKLTSSGSDAEIAVAAKLKAAIDTRVDEVAPLSTNY